MTFIENSIRTQFLKIQEVPATAKNLKISGKGLKFVTPTFKEGEKSQSVQIKSIQDIDGTIEISGENLTGKTFNKSFNVKKYIYPASVVDEIHGKYDGTEVKWDIDTIQFKPVLKYRDGTEFAGPTKRHIDYRKEDAVIIMSPKDMFKYTGEPPKSVASIATPLASGHIIHWTDYKKFLDAPTDVAIMVTLNNGGKYYIPKYMKIAAIDMRDDKKAAMKQHIEEYAKATLRNNIRLGTAVVCTRLFSQPPKPPMFGPAVEGLQVHSLS